MNATFETVRKELKKYNAEENESPPKLVLSGKGDFLDIESKRKTNSQFIIGVKEFHRSEDFLMEEMLDDLELKTGRKPIAFLYDDNDTINTVINDFKDYYNMSLGKDLFQKVGSNPAKDDCLYYLIIVVFESDYYRT